MAAPVLFPIPNPASHTWSRVLTCTACGCQVEVFEIPTPRIDPDAYVCGGCLCDPEPTPKAAA